MDTPIWFAAPVGAGMTLASTFAGELIPQAYHPLLFWVGIGLIVFGIFGGAAQYWWFPRPNKRDAPQRLSLIDFQELDKKQDFQLYELAGYWVNEKPSLPLSKKTAIPFAIMQEAIETKNLKVIKDDNREILIDAAKRVNHGLRPDANPHWRVARQDAVSYANSRGEQPAFLFPKRRIHAQ